MDQKSDPYLCHEWPLVHPAGLLRGCKEAASKPWVCNAVSRAGIGALEMASAAGRLGVLSCGVNGSFATPLERTTQRRVQLTKNPPLFVGEVSDPVSELWQNVFASSYCSAAHSSGWNRIHSPGGPLP